MDERSLQKRLILAAIVNFLIVGMEGYALWLTFIDIKFKMFYYYTILSNILALVAALLGLIFVIKALVTRRNEIPMWLKTVKYIASCMLFITFVMVAFVLSPKVAFDGGSYFTFFSGAFLFTHLLCPIVTILDFVFLEPAERLETMNVVISFAVTLVYGIVMVILNCVHVVDGPYFFLQIRSNPIYLSIIYFVFILAFAYLTSIFMQKLEAHLGPCIH